MAEKKRQIVSRVSHKKLQTVTFLRFQSMSVADSAALSACILAAEIGGVPLVLGMTIYSGFLRFVVGSFTYKLRRFFPAAVTGTMIFILGINLIPTAMKNFLGSAVNGVYNPMHLLVAVLTLLFMLSCTLFVKPLKPYTALLGIIFGFILSAVTGVFDLSSLEQVAARPLSRCQFIPDCLIPSISAH